MKVLTAANPHQGHHPAPPPPAMTQRAQFCSICRNGCGCMRWVPVRGTGVGGLGVRYRRSSMVGFVGMRPLSGSVYPTAATTAAPVFLCPQETPSYTCTLTRLDVRGNDIGAPGAAALTTALTFTGNATLTSLNLNGNAIGDEGGLAVAALLAVRVFPAHHLFRGHPAVVQCCDVRIDCDFPLSQPTRPHGSPLSPVYSSPQSNSPLAHLDVGNCDLRTDAVLAIATALHGNTNLRELGLDNTRTFSKMVRGVSAAPPPPCPRTPSSHPPAPVTPGLQSIAVATVTYLDWCRDRIKSSFLAAACHLFVAGGHDVPHRSHVARKSQLVGPAPCQECDRGHRGQAAGGVPG